MHIAYAKVKDNKNKPTFTEFTLDFCFRVYAIFSIRILTCKEQKQFLGDLGLNGSAIKGNKIW